MHEHQELTNVQGDNKERRPEVRRRDNTEKGAQSLEQRTEHNETAKQRRDETEKQKQTEKHTEKNEEMGNEEKEKNKKRARPTSDMEEKRKKYEDTPYIPNRKRSR